MRHRAVWIAFERFEQQGFGPHQLSLGTTAPAIGDIGDQDRSQPDFRLDRLPIGLQRPLERVLSLLAVRRRQAPVPPCPAAHNQVASIGISCLFLFDLTPDRLR